MDTTDFNYLVEHSREIFERYAGKWIAVHDGAVVASGDTATEVAEAAREKTGGDEFVLEAVEPDGDVVYASVRLA